MLGLGHEAFLRKDAAYNVKFEVDKMGTIYLTNKKNSTQNWLKIGSVGGNNMLIMKQRLFSRSGINFNEINQVIQILDFKISSLYDMTPHKTFILESRLKTWFNLKA